MSEDNTNNKSKLIIGLDLSFNSTGISIAILDTNNIGKKLSLFRILRDKEINKTGKIYTPEKIRNVNNIIYRMPTNVSPLDFILDANNINNLEQIEATIRAMICSKKICSVLAEYVVKYKPSDIIVSIENYIMPAFSGKNQLKSVSGLILLQGFVREFFIRLKISQNINVKIFTPTAKENKLFFTGNGNAEKSDMISTFFSTYDGGKLVGLGSEKQINDVIDAFSLMLFGYKKYLKTLESDDNDEKKGKKTYFSII